MLLVVASDPLPLATPADLARYLGLPAFTGEDEQRALLVLRLAASTVRRRTRQTFTSGSSTVVLPVPDGEWLSLPERPVRAVTSVTVDSLPVSGWSLINGRVYLPAGWFAVTPTVTVTYEHGGPVPDDVLSAALAVAADLWENPRDLGGESIDDYTWRASNTSSGSRASQELRELVREYRPRPLTVAVA